MFESLLKTQNMDCICNLYFCMKFVLEALNYLRFPSARIRMFSGRPEVYGSTINELRKFETSKCS